MTNTQTTILEEIVALGIEPEHFNTLYSKLKETKQLPPENAIPTEQYTKIMGYLRTNGILGENNELQEKRFELFHKRRYLENFFRLRHSLELDLEPIPVDTFRVFSIFEILAEMIVEATSPEGQSPYRSRCHNRRDFDLMMLNTLLG